MTDEPTKPSKMKSFWSALIPIGLIAPIIAMMIFLMTGSGCDPKDNVAVANLRAAVDNPARSEDARARDAGRLPVKVMAVYGVRPGMTILEVGAGSGYYTEILSAAVGPEGRVIAQNTPSDYYKKYVADTFEPLAARLSNVDPHVGALGDLNIPDESLDLALIFLIYHHMHYDAAEGERLPVATQRNLERIRAALKPGAVLAVIEHAAPNGTNRADSAAIHRVDEATTVADFTGAGFNLVDKSRVLQVKTDDRSIYWYDTPHQGKTWRLMHKYIKR
jgi:predicted methyltransferase